MGSLFKLLGTFLAVTLLAHAAEKPPLRHASMNVANGCFVESVVFLDEFHDAFGGDTWARLLQWGAKEDEEVVMGHAVAVCEAGGKLWCWDINYGWSSLPVEVAQKESAEIVARPILAKYPRISASFPTYRFESSAQTADPAPPVARLADDNPAIRDASIAAARLALHRPVNLVQFSYREGEETKQGAAVVFSFHGRYCLYSPLAGTIPFRARGSIKNTRLLQEALRRLYPGAFAVKPLS